MIDIATPEERLARARHSHNLRIDGRCRGDVDYLAAAGMAARTMRVGGALMKLESSGASALPGAMDAVRRVVKSMNARQRWRLNGKAMESLTELALLKYMAPTAATPIQHPDELEAIVLELTNIKAAMQRRIERFVR